jgi:mono/diheme cytochrome c family protein
MKFLSSLLVLTSALVVAQPAGAVPATDPDYAGVLFAGRIWPLMADKCLACHGNDEDKLKGGLDLRTFASAREGGDSGEPSIVPGKPAESPFYLAATRTHDDWEAMPPKENDRLSPDQIGWIKEWIEAGAPWPEPARREELAKRAEVWSTADGVLVKTSPAESAEWQNRRYDPAALWAFQPVKKPAVPAGQASNPIDAFINARLTAVQLSPAPAADPRTFIRRATFDLTGLPPTPEEVAAFMRASISNPQLAIANLIDRLLASPHYGERQAQHWLDATRYADTSGFSNDFERPGAWRYRDYVVRAFNSDKPYDQFVREQIAGDQLDPGNSELAVAAGFLRLGPWESTAMNSPEVTRQQFLDDVVNHVGEVFLALPLRCAKCHDHKFDPLPTRDYYSMMAFFGDTHPAELDAPFFPGEVLPDGRAEKERATREIAALNAEIDAIGRKHFDAGLGWLKEKGTDTSAVKFRGGGFFNTFNTFFTAIPEEQRPPRNLGLTPDEISRLAILSKYRSYHKRAIDRFAPVAFTVYSGPPNGYVSNNERNGRPGMNAKRENPPIHILVGGGIDAPGEAVSPAVLSFVETLADLPPKKISATAPRIALADWIADPRNPLTARTIVNRVWQQHFAGRGLVASTNNFGKMGSRPSHPELLDYLAAQLVESGWSLKALQRLILTSDTYRRSARHPHPDAVTKADPNAELLAAYPVRRLSAEEIRDAMLAASGELNPAIGGVPVFPEINLEAALQPRYVMSGVAPSYQPSPTPSERHRRTLYSFRMRGLTDPLLEVFNRPGSDLSCDRRDSTTVTPQVFALFNGQQPNDRALALALRVEREAPTVPTRIALAYDRVYARVPTADELSRAGAYLEKMTTLHRATPVERVPLPKSVRRSMVGEMTGATTEWDEALDIFSGPFIADPKPWDVGPETRALSALCLVLFNSNEFLYVE